MQLLPREAYVQQDWFDREQRELFSRNWSYVGLSSEIALRGYATVNVGAHRQQNVLDCLEPASAPPPSGI